MAKTRPLSKQVYDTFRLLGAPDSLTLIGYREPFAFLGWKGAPKGAAALAQDAKKQSKELLRLDAVLATDAAGRLSMTHTSSQLKLLEKLDEAADRENTAPPKKKKASLAGVAKHIGQLALIATAPVTFALPSGFHLFWLSSTAFTAASGEAFRLLDKPPPVPPSPVVATEASPPRRPRRRRKGKKRRS